MGSDQWHTPSEISCILCKKTDENEITGALSSKENISAHQNCLLYASGICCVNSPIYDDLFGFSVEDVKKEERRGRKLNCGRCKRRGATAGCDIKHCRLSYHYPCAIEANARVIEDSEKGIYKLFCEKHDPQTKKTSSVNGASTSGLNLLKRCASSDSGGQIPDRNESNSSTGSERGLPCGRKRKSLVDTSDSDDESHTSIFAPVESDLDDLTPPKQHNSTHMAGNARAFEELNLSSTGSVYGASTSGLNHSKGDGSPASPGQLNDRIGLDSPTQSPEVETPRRKRKKLLVLFSDDDEPQTSIDPVVSPAVSAPVPQTHSTPVTKNTRPCEINPLTTGDDGDDTDIDSDVSQSLLTTENYNVTVPCIVIMDSGPSMESENSIEPCSPSNAAPACVCSSPGAAPEPKDTSSTKITAPEPKPPTTGSVSPGSADLKPHQENSSRFLSYLPGSPDHSSPTTELPAAFSSAVQPLLSSHITADHPAGPTSPAGVSSSPDRPAAAEDCRRDATPSLQSSAAKFWARCNEAGYTEEIFSELVSQLRRIGERIQSQEASHQDFDVALEVLTASRRFPTIITQLEQDLEKQEQELQRKKAALRDARAVLAIYSLN